MTATTTRVEKAWSGWEWPRALDCWLDDGGIRRAFFAGPRGTVIDKQKPVAGLDTHDFF